MPRFVAEPSAGRRGRAWLHVVPALVLLASSQVAAQDSETAPELRASRIVDVSSAVAVDRRPVISAVAISPDGTQLAVGGDDHLVRITSASDGQLLRTLDEHFDWVRAVVYRPDGAELATAGDDRLIHLWSAADGTLLRTLRHSGDAIRTLAFSPDGTMLAAAGFDARITIYDPTTGRVRKTLEPTTDDVFGLAFSPDSTRLAAACSQGRVRLWHLPEAASAQELSGDSHRLRCLAFSPDGSQLAAGGDGPLIYLWGTSGAEPVQSLAVRPGKVLCLSFLGGDTLAAGLTNNQIKLYALATGEVDLRMTGHTGSIAALVWDPTRDALVSGSFDTSVRVWNFGQREPATAREAGAPGELR